MWTPTPSGIYTVAIQSEIDAYLGTSIQWDGTIDGAWTVSAGELAGQVSQAQALLLSTMLLDTAPAEVVIARALDAGLTPKDATKSRYIVRSGGTGTLPTGTLVQGGGTDGRARWTVIDATAAVTPGSLVTIEAVDGGAVSLPSTVTLTLVVPVAGITSLTYDSSDGDAFQVGRPAESIAQLRVRTRRAEAARAGSPAGVAAALRELDWVVAADVRTSAAGFVAPTVTPAPVGADQEAELAATIYGAVSLGVLTSGSASLSTTDINGAAVSVNYTAGVVENAAVVSTLTLDGTVPAAEVEAAATAAIEAEFALLAPGDPIYRIRVLAALDLPGVTAASLTIGGSSGDAISPSTIADVLAASPITLATA